MVKWIGKFLTAFEAPERRLDGHVAVVFHELMSKGKFMYLADRESRK